MSGIRFIGMILLFFFSACEGGTTFTKSIDNRTSEIITIQLFTSDGAYEQLSIKSNEIQEIYWNDRLGSFVDESYTCLQEIDSFDITISNNKELIKDIMEPDNWSKTSKDGRNSREDCIFTILNEDIQ